MSSFVRCLLAHRICVQSRAEKAEAEQQETAGRAQTLQNDISASSAIINDVFRNCSSVRAARTECDSFLPATICIVLLSVSKAFVTE